MPWAGDGNEGNLLSNIPTGWILCDGRVYQASRYPLLASIIGNSYGGTPITGEFPHYVGTVKVPDITGRVLMDLEQNMLANTKYQYGQSDAYSKLFNLVVDDGLSVSVPTLISADTDLAFNVTSNIEFVGKMTGGPNATNISISPPSFSTTIYTVPRKLGINHMPYHKHPGTYTSAQAFQAPPDTFSPSSMTVGGSRTLENNCGTSTWNEATFNNAENAETWCSGLSPITFYDENTLIQTNQFNTFISTVSYDYSKIPALTATARVLESQIYTDAFTSIPVTTHAEDAWTGMFPRPIETSNRRNYFGINTGTTGPTGLADDPEGRDIFTVGGVTITSGQSQITLPSGTDITDANGGFTRIVPYMYITSNETLSAFIDKGTQVLNVVREGQSPNYTYILDLSKPATGAGSVSGQVSFKYGTFPTTLNSTAAAQDPSSTTFQSHNHASFDLTMNNGNLSGPTTHPVTNVQRGDVVPETITGALNIIANIANPSLNVVYIIRAY